VSYVTAAKARRQHPRIFKESGDKNRELGNALIFGKKKGPQLAGQATS